MPSSNAWSAQSTTLPWIPGYCLPWIIPRGESFAGDLRFVIGQNPPLASAQFQSRSQQVSRLYSPWLVASVPSYGASWQPDFVALSGLRRTAVHLPYPNLAGGLPSAEGPSSFASAPAVESRDKRRRGLFFSPGTHP